MFELIYLSHLSHLSHLSMSYIYIYISSISAILSIYLSIYLSYLSHLSRLSRLSHLSILSIYLIYLIYHSIYLIKVFRLIQKYSKASISVGWFYLYIYLFRLSTSSICLIYLIPSYLIYFNYLSTYHDIFLSFFLGNYASFCHNTRSFYTCNLQVLPDDKSFSLHRTVESE